MSTTEEKTPPGPRDRDQNPDARNAVNEARVYDSPERSAPEAATAEPTRRNRDGDASEEKKDGEQDKPKDEAGAKKRFALALGIGAAVLLVLFIVGLVPRLRARPALEKTAERNAGGAPEVDVLHATRGPLSTNLTLPGNIEALQETDITARATGYVSQWLVDIGDSVRAGQVLAIIDTPEVEQQVREAEANLSQARAALVQQRAEYARALANLAQSRQNSQRQKSQLVQAQADLNLAKITSDRWLFMVKEGAVSRQAADEKVAAYSNNRANVASLQSAVVASRSDIAAFEAALRSSEANIGAAQAGVQASEANVSRIKALNAFRQVRAPFSGVVTSRSVDAGAFSGGGAGSESGGSSSGGASSLANSNSQSPAAPSSGQGASSARGQMYGSAPGTGAAGGAGSADNGGVGGGTVGGNGGAAMTGESGDSQAAGGGAVGAAGGSGVSGGSDGGGIASSAPAQTGANGGNGAGRANGAGAAVSQSSGVGGAAISPGVSLYRIARVDVLRVQVNVPQSFAPRVQVGNIAKVFVNEFAGENFIGKVTRTSRSLDPQTRTMLTEIQISNRDKRLLPGMYAQIEFSVSRGNAPLVVPAGALIDNGRGTQVAIVSSDNKIQLVSVRVGRDYGQQIEIVDGLRASDWLVVDPSDATQEGVSVKPITPEEKKRREDEQKRKQQEKAGKGDGQQGAGGQQQGGDEQQQKGDSQNGGQQGGGQQGGGQQQTGGSGAPTPNVGQSYGGALMNRDSGGREGGGRRR